MSLSENVTNLKVMAAFSDMLTPDPAQITQTQDQYVRLAESHYYYSLYLTESQTTTVLCYTAKNITYSRLEPMGAQGSVISFGPYHNVPALKVLLRCLFSCHCIFTCYYGITTQYSDFRVRSINNSPFAKFISLTREYDVNSW